MSECKSKTGKYTVVGFYEETGQIFSHHVNAESTGQAFYQTSEEHETAVLLAVLDGHVEEGKGITFSGDSIVDAATVLSQPEVFN